MIMVSYDAMLGKNTDSGGVVQTISTSLVASESVPAQFDGTL
jgi:hypothetical protein